MHGGLQWFPLTMRDPGEYWRGVAAAQPALDRFLDAELARYRLAPDRLVLVGFSQGTHDGAARRSAARQRRRPASSAIGPARRAGASG